MVRFFILFVVVLAALFGLELTPWAQTWFVVPWTNALAAISTSIVTLFDPNVVAAGKVLRIPSNVPHRAVALEDTLDLDIFSPIRIDWLKKDDAYLRG